MKRAAVLLVLMAAALSGGAARSQAVFVASSQNTGSSVSTAAVFNAVEVSLADPGTPRRGTVALSATATSDRPIAGVTFETMRQGTGAWTARCVDAVAPYTCDWDTVGVTEGLYDLRATALDDSGYSKTATVTDRRVDNTPPAVTMTDPGPVLSGTVAIGATATDTEGAGVASVEYEHRPAGGGAWTAICTDDGAPYGCSWSTAALADGSYDLRATATDAAGNTAASTVTGRPVDNAAPAVAMTDPGTPVGGTVALQSTSGDGNGAGVTSVSYQYRVTGSIGAWMTACTAVAAPFSCSWSTGALNGLYDVRATATDGAALETVSAAITSRRIDNTAPSVATMTDPGTPLSGTVTLGGTATDTVGLGSMRFEYRAAGATGAWFVACTDGSPPSPFSCGWDTTAVADGGYDLRAVAIDQAGNTRTTPTVTARVVDNDGPLAAVTGPAQLRGSANTVTTTVTDVTGIASVAIRYRPSGGGAYTTLCTDAAGPAYTCAWNATGLADGAAYDVVAVATDTLGHVSTSAPYTAVVNASGPTGTDVQGANGGVNDRLDAGDSITFTYSAAIAPGSILPGWSGASPAAIRVRVNNSGTSDSLELYDAANTAPLGLLAAGTALAINIDHVTAPTLFNATIARSGSTFTVTLGSLISGAVTSAPKGKSAMVWRTSSRATAATGGKPVFATTVTESGGSDLDF